MRTASPTWPGVPTTSTWSPVDLTTAPSCGSGMCRYVKKTNTTVLSLHKSSVGLIVRCVFTWTHVQKQDICVNKRFEMSLFNASKQVEKINMPKGSHRYCGGCLYSMTSPLRFLLRFCYPPPPLLNAPPCVSLPPHFSFLLVFLFFFFFLLHMSLSMAVAARRGSCAPKCLIPLKTVWPAWPGTQTANDLSLVGSGDSFISV